MSKIGPSENIQLENYDIEIAPSVPKCNVLGCFDFSHKSNSSNFD
jgi:hypothetical protein